MSACVYTVLNFKCVEKSSKAQGAHSECGITAWLCN